MSYSSPLKWPSDVPRHKGVRTAGDFRIGADLAMRDLDGELRRFSQGTPTITSDARVGMRSQRFLTDELESLLREPAITIFCRRHDRDLAFALDRYSTPLANLRALTLCLGALRTVERHGGGAIEDRALAGFAALPAQAGMTVAHWSIVLGMVASYEGRASRALTFTGEQVRLELIREAEARYKDLARKHHSDVAGGDHEAMVELNRAIGEARKELAP